MKIDKYRYRKKGLIILDLGPQTESEFLDLCSMLLQNNK